MAMLAKRKTTKQEIRKSDFLYLKYSFLRRSTATHLCSSGHLVQTKRKHQTLSLLVDPFLHKEVLQLFLSTLEVGMCLFV